MPGYGLCGKIVAVPGNGDALASHLLEAAAALEAVAGCELYVVSRERGGAPSVTGAGRGAEAHRPCASSYGKHGRAVRTTAHRWKGVALPVRGCGLPEQVVLSPGDRAWTTLRSPLDFAEPDEVVVAVEERDSRISHGWSTISPMPATLSRAFHLAGSSSRTRSAARSSDCGRATSGTTPAARRFGLAVKCSRMVPRRTGA
jgi:hypothetical protein